MKERLQDVGVPDPDGVRRLAAPGVSYYKRHRLGSLACLASRAVTALPGGVRGLPVGVRAPETARRRCQHGPIATEMTASAPEMALQKTY